jgi:hypothetical protein
MRNVIIIIASMIYGSAIAVLIGLWVDFEGGGYLMSNIVGNPKEFTEQYATVLMGQQIAVFVCGTVLIIWATQRRMNKYRGYPRMGAPRKVSRKVSEERGQSTSFQRIRRGLGPFTTSRNNAEKVTMPPSARSRSNGFG